MNIKKTKHLSFAFKTNSANIGSISKGSIFYPTIYTNKEMPRKITDGKKEPDILKNVYFASDNKDLKFYFVLSLIWYIFLSYILIKIGKFIYEMRRSRLSNVNNSLEVTQELAIEVKEEYKNHKNRTIRV